MNEPIERPVTPLAFVDTETTGLHPGREAWDIAIIRREPDGTQTEWQAYVEVDLSTADPMALRIGRFYERHPLGRRLSRQASPDEHWTTKPPLAPTHAAHRVAEHTYGAHIVGAVPSFDTITLENLLRDHGLLPAWHYHLVDIEVLALGYLAARGQVFTPPYKSDELHEALGLEPTPPEERHTALGDAKWAMRVYDAVMGEKALAEPNDFQRAGLLRATADKLESWSAGRHDPSTRDGARLLRFWANDPQRWREGS